MAAVPTQSASASTSASTADIKVVLLDIEGTVCPISFVKDVLFPYALNALPGVLKSQWDDPGFARYRDAFPPQFASSQATLEGHVKDLMNRDVKISYLKSLQGYLWETGYRHGELQAPLFTDVAPKMMAWTGGDDGSDSDGGRIHVMIYSSGSVPAQKLLFGHTNSQPPDLIPAITDFFDTVNAGPKTEAASYEKIAARHPQHPPSEWLFLSDNVNEVEAAIQAGMRSFVVQRPGNPGLPEGVEKQFRVIRSFDEL